MAVDEKLRDALAGHLFDLRESDKRDNSIIRLSGAGYCSRQLGYILLDANKEPEPLGTLCVFQIGHAFHAMTQRWLVDMGLVEPEHVEYTMINESRRIRGTCDAISVRMNKEGAADPKGTRRVFEIKSISNMPREFNGRQLDGAFNKLDKPKDHHSDQATCYAYLWNEQHPDDPVTAITFVYVAKDGAELESPFKLFTVPLSERRWIRLQAKFAAIWQAVDAGELPDRDEDPYSQFSPCRFCSFLGLCLDSDAPPDDDEKEPVEDDEEYEDEEA